MPEPQSEPPRSRVTHGWPAACTADCPNGRLRTFGVIALALEGALVALWRSRRAPTAAKTAYMRRFVSRRIADRDARGEQALVSRDDDGGANEGGANAGYPMTVFAGVRWSAPTAMRSVLVELFISSSDWRVESIPIELQKDIADRIGASRTFLHRGTIELPVSFIQSVSDAIVLSIGRRAVHAIARDPEGAERARHRLRLHDRPSFGLSTSVWGRVAVEEAPQACSACSTRACYDTLAASAVAVASSRWYVLLGMTCACASGEIGPSADGALLTVRVGPPIRTPHARTPFASAAVVHPIPAARWPVANSLHFGTSMPAMRDVVLTAIGIAWVVVLVSPMLRRATARKLTEARRLVSRRVVDEEARANLRVMVAREGGAMLGRSDADGTSHANPMIELLPRWG